MPSCHCPVLFFGRPDTKTAPSFREKALAVTWLQRNDGKYAGALRCLCGVDLTDVTDGHCNEKQFADTSLSRRCLRNDPVAAAYFTKRIYSMSARTQLHRLVAWHSGRTPATPTDFSSLTCFRSLLRRTDLSRFRTGKDWCCFLT